MNTQFIELEIYQEHKENDRILINVQYIIKIERTGKDDAVFYLTDGTKHQTKGISSYSRYLELLEIIA